MRSTARIILSTTFVILAGTLAMNGASAQSAASGCTLQPVGGTARQILRCPAEGLTIVAEAGARFSLGDRNRDGRVDRARLQSKALLLDVTKKQTGTAFQVDTPQAIAAVRGTKWAVDVGGGKTSVFVVRGRVNVRRPDTATGVFLDPGEGVDVDRGSGPLTVKRWPRPRVAALMARLGQ